MMADQKQLKVEVVTEEEAWFSDPAGFEEEYFS